LNWNWLDTTGLWLDTTGLWLDTTGLWIVALVAGLVVSTLFVGGISLRLDSREDGEDHHQSDDLHRFAVHF
jgi:hypothetical protein